jgi:hypothetical protein
MDAIVTIIDSWLMSPKPGRFNPSSNNGVKVSLIDEIIVATSPATKTCQSGKCGSSLSSLLLKS